ncbi:hypothetical protein A3A75_02605 [Candidatus Woesebacteria bacterium RIFCSPLOWO2_01_FULL_39_10]|uniref:Uncharacterized protein n=1 Tax=Candidatus Woesebacteria bacterium RIFCSPLOWO2_01_FULL_39_10 TaxID=1802516 RepID=A0A1F8B798_9BACT|nr:MAG: hypothetical protein A3A75_02605 [Candidatus Woesebacteria bacterium RIFCSPLOWO2_01_FULL_39_10]
MGIEIKNFLQVSDKEVPEFGNSFGHLRAVEPRLHEELSEVGDMALLRVLHYSYCIGPNPYVRFPDAECVQHYPFPDSAWQKYGNMESEAARIEFMLDNFETRAMPTSFGKHLAAISLVNPLEDWAKIENDIQVVAHKEYEKMKKDQAEGARAIYDNGYETAYVADPQFYEVDQETTNAEVAIWKNSLSQIARELQKGNFKNLGTFLNLYSRVKDPITPIVGSEQERLFRELYEKASNSLQTYLLSYDLDEKMVAQIAKESAFLALPKANEATTRFAGHQELPIVRIDLSKMPRGEFAGPERVCEIMLEELKDAEKVGQASITPVTVAYSKVPDNPESIGSPKKEPFLFIIDGNNRASSLIAFEYFKTYGLDIEKLLNRATLDEFMGSCNLDLEWEVDLVGVLKYLRENSHVVNELRQKQGLLQLFNINNVPALLTHEPDYHTIAIERSKNEGRVIIMGPHNQALFNSTNVSIYAKKQSHGRAEGNNEKQSI